MKWFLFFLFVLQGCSHLFYQPVKPHYVDPKQFKLTYNDIQFKSKDSTNLHGWFFPTTKAKVKGTIIQFHGNAQNISTHFYSLMWLVHEGYNLFTFDYRGYGKSEGDPYQKGVYEDALAALEKAKELHEANGKGLLIVYGQSLGGVISLRALPDYTDHKKVDLLVLDSTFSSYRLIAFDKLTDHWFLVPFSILTPVLISDNYASSDVFDKLEEPTLVIVGEKDRVVPAKFGKKIFESIKPTEKWLWDVPEGQHIDVFHHGQNEYRQRFLKFLDELGRK